MGLKCAVLVGGIDMLAQARVAEGGDACLGGGLHHPLKSGMHDHAQSAHCVLSADSPPRSPQALALGRRPHIVVGTPGRVLDHLTNTKVRLGERLTAVTGD